MVICLERGVDLHMAWLMPQPLTVSCFSKIQIGFSYLVPAHPGSLGKGPLNGCVCLGFLCLFDVWCIFVCTFWYYYTSFVTDNVKMWWWYVRQMLRKSVETRDCLSAIEPRTVRAVMKRVVEDVAAMDVVIGQLYEEGTRTERTSDSTRRSYSFTIGRQGAASGPARSTWSITPRLVGWFGCVN